jgi:hypothetical protein
VKRWFWWFLLAPWSFLVAGLWSDAGLPPLDMGALCCLHLAFVAERAAVPWLLLGLATGRALVDEASLPIQILVLGVPIGLLLPLRALLFGQRWLWTCLCAAGCAWAIPTLAAFFGRVFDQPSVSATVDGMNIVWAAVLVPFALVVVRALPPCRAFEEER